MAAPVWNRVGPGVYDSQDGRFTMYRIEGVQPPAWNVDWHTDEMCRMVDADPEHRTGADYGSIVDGAASMRDAVAIAAQEIAAIDGEQTDCDKFGHDFSASKVTPPVEFGGQPGRIRYCTFCGTEAPRRVKA